jgi:signal transduction histidine kinase/CheY-like chemotaxis protein
MRLRIQLHFKTIGFVFILVIIVMSVLLLHAYNEAVSLVKDQFNEQQMLVAKQTAIGIEENIKLLERELEWLSGMPAIKNHDSKGCSKLLKKTFSYAKAFHVNDVALIDSKGICKLPLMAPHLKGKDFSFRKYFKKASKLTTNKPTYQFITFKGVEKGSKGIVIAMPIFSHGGEFDGVILFTIKVDELIKGFAPRQSENRVIWAIGHNGGILYHPQYPPGTLIDGMPNLEPSYKAFVKSIRNGRPYNGEYISPEGIKIVASSYPVSITDEKWSLVISTPEGVASKLLRSFSIDFALAVSITLLVILSSSLTIIYLINRWNLELESTVESRTRELALFREVDRLKTEFVSLVSHELRTPLTSIKAFIEILLKNPGRDMNQQKEFFEIIREEANRLTRVIDDILNIKRIEERRIDLDRKPVDIAAVIRQSVLAHRSRAQRNNIKITMDVTNDIQKILGDQDLLMQVLSNLLNNAIKFTPQNGAIHVSSTHVQRNPGSSNEIEVRVKDNGIGIQPKYLTKIFDKFYRIDRDLTREESGTGLGLYFCKYIVEGHGGRIWVESKKRKGSTFVFTLPAEQEIEMVHEPIYDKKTDDLLPPEGGLREDVSVLVVDDEKRIRSILREYLKEEGFKIYEAENGSEALKLAKIEKPTVILLDAVMPGIDGFEVMESLDENEETKHIPVIVLSGSEDSKLAIELGAADYLVKPIERETLIKAVSGVLGKLGHTP